VYLYNLKTGTQSKIHEIQTKTIPFTDYFVRFRDVKFSPDGKLIGITSSDGFWTYSLDNSDLKQIFSLPVQIPPTPTPIRTTINVYAYANPLISPDNSEAILIRGYYEGADQIKVDLTTGVITELNGFSFYISGKKALAWIDKDHILINTYGDATEREFSSTLDIARVSDLAIDKTYTLKGSINSYDVNNGKIYLLLYSRMLNGKTVNNVPLEDSQYTIEEINVGTGERRTLYQKIANYEDNTQIPETIKIWSNEKLVLSTLDIKNVSDPFKPHSLSILDLAETTPVLTPLISPGSLTVN
jgi:hypothetical protein